MDNWSQLHDQSLPFGVQGQSSTHDVFCGDRQLSFSFIWFVNSYAVALDWISSDLDYIDK